MFNVYVDKTNTIRNMMEKHLAKKKLCNVIVDLDTASDEVPREVMR